MVKYKIVQKTNGLKRRFRLAGKKNSFGKKLKEFFSAIKRVLTFNITTMMFGALFIYMVITVILYATSSHVTS